MTDLDIFHEFQSTAPDGADPTVFRPSDQNARHRGNGLMLSPFDQTSPAVGDGVADDEPPINATLVDAGVGFTALPTSDYLVGASLETLIHSKLDGLGSRLLPDASSMIVLLLKAGQTLQDGDYLLVRDLRIDATGKAGVTGVATTGDAVDSIAHGILENVIALACETGFDFGNAQFLRTYNLRAVGGDVGVLIKNEATSGGANSHDHYGLHAVNAKVGVVVNGTRGFTPAWSLNFYNPQILVNSVCGMAFFNSEAIIYGGAPENNGYGAATAVIDGQTVKRSSMYLVNSLVRVYGLHNGEYDPSPCFLLEDHSVLVLIDASGYGLTTGQLVRADDTSSVNLEGTYACMGECQNVGAWPDSWLLPTSGVQSILFGAPVHSLDPTLPVLFSHPAPAMGVGGVHNPTVTYVEDADLGYCTQVVFPAYAGQGVSDSIATMAFAGAASKDTAISVLVKSSVDTTIGFSLHDGAVFHRFLSETLVLKAGKVTRVLMGRRDIPAGAWMLYWYPIAADAPTVKFANAQCYQGTQEVQTTTLELAKIIKHGAFNPGPIRATTTNLELQSAAVNTKGKYPGKQVWNSTTNRVVYAVGRAVGDVWKDGVNATVHTPV